MFKKILVTVFSLMSFSVFANTEILHPSFGPVSQAQKGACFSSSIASDRRDAFRCMIGNTIVDPCFSVAKKQGYVVCANDQRPPQFNQWIQLTKPLPAPQKNLAKNPWLLQLSNGIYCSPMTGTRPVILGTVMNYDCEDKKLANGQKVLGLRNDFSRGKTWTVTAIFSDEHNQNQKAKKIAIQKVWI